MGPVKSNVLFEVACMYICIGDCTFFIISTQSEVVCNSEGWEPCQFRHTLLSLLIVDVCVQMTLCCSDDDCVCFFWKEFVFVCQYDSRYYIAWMNLYKNAKTDVTTLLPHIHDDTILQIIFTDDTRYFL